MRFWDRLRISVRAIGATRANSPLRRVQLARLPSVTGRWAYTIALAIYAYRSDGATGVALASLVRVAPAGLTAPFTGALIRRVRLGLLLCAGGVLRTAALAAAGVLILSGSPAALVYTLVACEVAVSTLMRPAQNSLLPLLARTPEELTMTNLALSMITSAACSSARCSAPPSCM